MHRALLGTVASCLLLPLAAGRAEEPAGVEDAIRAATAAYVEAFNRHDAKAVADFWSPDAVYTNRLTGETFVGRPAIAGQFAALYRAQPDVKLSATTESVQFLSPNVAVEHGSANLVIPKGEPERISYSAVHVRRNDRWMLDRVTDAAPENEDSHYEPLKALEWMIGTWAVESDAGRVVTECKWTKKRNFITRSFSVSAGEEVKLSGMQIVGWDPAAKAIRSWTFDSDGGFAEATWTLKQDRWYIHNQGVLADGRKATAVNVVKPIDASSFSWRTVERTAGGELLPNIDEIVMVRQ